MTETGRLTAAQGIVLRQRIRELNDELEAVQTEAESLRAALAEAQRELALVREVLNTDLKTASERVLTLELANQSLQSSLVDQPTAPQVAYKTSVHSTEDTAFMAALDNPPTPNENLCALAAPPPAPPQRADEPTKFMHTHPLCDACVEYEMALQAAEAK